MKKVFKFLFTFLEIAVLVLLVLYYAVTSIQTKFADYFKWILLAFILLTTFWIVYFCIALYKKEIGETVEGKIRYKKDKERKIDKPVSEGEAVDVYSNFERAEFTSKIKDSYQKEIYAFPANMPEIEIPVEEKHVEEKPVEVIKETPKVKEVKKEEKVEKPVKKETEKKPAPKKEEAKVAVTKVEEKPVEKPVPKKAKVVNFTLWEGNTVKVSEGWVEFLTKELEKKDIKANLDAIKAIYESETVVYPTKENLLKPLEYSDLANTHVVILGKLPYYRKNQADGLAYSTDAKADINQSTEVIINEAIDDAKITKPKNGSLVKWAKQGVLLLNTVLTAPSNKLAAHTEIWKKFTEDIIKEVVKSPEPKVFVLWGEFAKEYLPLLKKKNTLVLEAANPSPLSAQSGFYGSKPFTKINKFLEAKGIEKINWQL